MWCCPRDPLSVSNIPTAAHSHIIDRADNSTIAAYDPKCAIEVEYTGTKPLGTTWHTIYAAASALAGKCVPRGEEGVSLVAVDEASRSRVFVKLYRDERH